MVATLPHFGYWFCSIAFQWLIAQETGNDPIALGMLYFFMLFPMLLLSIPAGVLADRIDRRSILASCQLAIVTIDLTMAILLWRGEPEVWIVMTCALAVGAVNSIANPSSAALVANSVPAKDLSSAVPLQVIGMNVARMLGPAFAGAVIFLVEQPGLFCYMQGWAQPGYLYLRRFRVCTHRIWLRTQVHF